MPRQTSPGVRSIFSTHYRCQAGISFILLWNSHGKKHTTGTIVAVLFLSAPHSTVRLMCGTGADFQTNLDYLGFVDFYRRLWYLGVATESI